MARKTASQVQSDPRRLLRAKVISLTSFFAVLIVGSLLCLPVMAKDSSNDPLKGIKAPSSQLNLRKLSAAELQAGIEEELKLGVKDKADAVSIGLRIGKDLPIDSHNFLDQVRSRIKKNKEYEGAHLSPVQTQNLGGMDWDFFTIERKDEIKQEFWARSISSDKILMLLYTTVGSYYEQYRNDFMKVVEQAARN